LICGAVAPAARPRPERPGERSEQEREMERSEPRAANNGLQLEGSPICARSYPHRRVGLSPVGSGARRHRRDRALSDAVGVLSARSSAVRGRDPGETGSAGFVSGGDRARRSGGLLLWHV